MALNFHHNTLVCRKIFNNFIQDSKRIGFDVPFVKVEEDVPEDDRSLLSSRRTAIGIDLDAFGRIRAFVYTVRDSVPIAVFLAPVFFYTSIGSARAELFFNRFSSYSRCRGCGFFVIQAEFKGKTCVIEQIVMEIIACIVQNIPCITPESEVLREVVFHSEPRVEYEVIVLLVAEAFVFI